MRWGRVVGIPFLELCSFREALRLRFSLHLASVFVVELQCSQSSAFTELCEELDRQLDVTADGADASELLSEAFSEALGLLQVHAEPSQD